MVIKSAIFVRHFGPHLSLNTTLDICVSCAVKQVQQQEGIKISQIENWAVEPELWSGTK